MPTQAMQLIIGIFMGMAVMWEIRLKEDAAVCACCMIGCGIAGILIGCLLMSPAGTEEHGPFD
jgi:hypothetical protein